MAGKYDDLTHAQLVELLQKRDRTKKLGLVWERDEIEADAAMDANFIACKIDEGLSDKSAPWDNLVIESDNFDALRWLRMTHAGRVKCIYIDPPYNTGNKDWVYNDSYMDKEDRFRQSTWLEFLYRRLTLARDLLAENGVLLVSINDEQRAFLEIMLSEVLPGMRLGTFVWRTRKGGYDSGNFSKDHDFVLVYGKPTFEFHGTDKNRSDYTNPDNDRRGLWTDDPLQQPKTFRQRKNAVYFITDPETGIDYPPNPNRVWSVGQRGDNGLTESPWEDLLKDNLLVFTKRGQYTQYDTLDELMTAIQDKTAHKFARKDLPNIEDWVGRKIGLGSVRKKKFLKDRREDQVNPISSLLDGIATEESLSIEVGKTKEGTREVRALFGESTFDYPKPVSLIRELVRQSTGLDDTVLDFFAGSATTAQAVMELNAEDGGSRRFIMVSSTEATEDDPDKNLCRDVTAERIRLLSASEDKKYADLAARFAYLRTHEIAFEDLDYDLQPADAWAALEAMHDLPLTLYDRQAAWNLHEGETTALVLVDRFDPGLLQWLQGRDLQNLFVYAWAPGQIAQHLDGTDVDIRPVRDTLVKRFQQ